MTRVELVAGWGGRWGYSQKVFQSCSGAEAHQQPEAYAAPDHSVPAASLKSVTTRRQLKCKMTLT
jgi:hypothetical protein